MQWCLGPSSLNTLGSLPSFRHSVVVGSTVVEASSFSVMALSVFRSLCFLAFWRFWNDLRSLTVGEHSRGASWRLRPGHWITRNALWPPSVVSVFYICCHWHLPTLKTIKSRRGKVFPASPQEAQTTVVHNPADGTKVRPLSCQPPLPPVTLVFPLCTFIVHRLKSGLFWTDNFLVLQNLTTVIYLGLLLKWINTKSK